MTFPRAVGQVPIFYGERTTGRPFDPNSKWTSKYIDMPNTPLFPFGHGLSYTTFAYSNLKTSADTLPARDRVAVSVDVKNTGARAGEEVVQMYVRHLNSAVERPNIELKGFRRIRLEPGQTKTVTLALAGEQLAYWDAKRKGFTVEPDSVRVMVGRSSADISLAKNVKVRP